MYGGVFLIKKKVVVCITQLIICLLLAVMGMTCTGCSVEKIASDKVKDIDYTVVTDTEIPEILKTSIEEKKKAPFKLSYSDNKELYIVVGYGEQPSGGYSIVVDELYLTDNTIVFASTLQGPDKKQDMESNPTYPYLVVKTEYIDYEVIYQ